MTSSNDGALVASVREGVIEAYCISAAAALLVYDYSITFGREVQVIWTARPIKSSTIFFLNRIVFLGIASSYIVELLPLGGIVSCKSSIVSIQLMHIACCAMWAAFSSLRVFAVCNRHVVLATLTLLLGLVPVATNLALQIPSTFLIVESNGEDILCEQKYSFSTSMIIKMDIASRTCLITAEAIVILATWIGVRKFNNGFPRLSTTRSIAQVLVQDGIMYFIALLLSNIADMVLFCLQISGDLAVITDALTSIFIAHILLNLREAQLTTPESAASRSTLCESGHITQGSEATTSTMVSRTSYEMHKLDHKISLDESINAHIYSGDRLHSLAERAIALQEQDEKIVADSKSRASRSG